MACVRCTFPRKCEGVSITPDAVPLPPLWLSYGATQVHELYTDAQLTRVIEDALMNDKTSASGSCQCGAVRLTVGSSSRHIVYCDCGQCRRSRGHTVDVCATHKGNLQLESEDRLAWYRSSDISRRAFCRVCGSNLFWYSDSADYVSVIAGSLDQPCALEAIEHTYEDSKADRYEINDELPQPSKGEGLARLYDCDWQKMTPAAPSTVRVRELSLLAGRAIGHCRALTGERDCACKGC
mgnify:CR=1 FL=1